MLQDVSGLLQYHQKEKSYRSSCYFQVGSANESENESMSDRQFQNIVFNNLMEKFSVVNKCSNSLPSIVTIEHFYHFHLSKHIPEGTKCQEHFTQLSYHYSLCQQKRRVLNLHFCETMMAEQMDALPRGVQVKYGLWIFMSHGSLQPFPSWWYFGHQLHLFRWDFVHMWHLKRCVKPLSIHSFSDHQSSMLKMSKL